jgi:hypothetical protein
MEAQRKAPDMTSSRGRACAAGIANDSIATTANNVPLTISSPAR